MSSGDERFHTPRPAARPGGYASSGDDRGPSSGTDRSDEWAVPQGGASYSARSYTSEEYGQPHTPSGSHASYASADENSYNQAAYASADEYKQGSASARSYASDHEYGHGASARSYASGDEYAQGGASARSYASADEYGHAGAGSARSAGGGSARSYTSGEEYSSAQRSGGHQWPAADHANNASYASDHGYQSAGGGGYTSAGRDGGYTSAGRDGGYTSAGRDGYNSSGSHHSTHSNHSHHGGSGYSSANEYVAPVYDSHGGPPNVLPFVPQQADGKLAGGGYGHGQPDHGFKEHKQQDSGVDDQVVEDIFSLARHGKISEVEDLLNRAVPVNVRDRHGNTILSVACQNGLKKMAKLALRRGADINARNYKGNTPLHFCYAYGYGDTLGAYLTSKGADTSLKNHFGATCYEGLGEGGEAKLG